MRENTSGQSDLYSCNPNPSLPPFHLELPPSLTTTTVPCRPSSAATASPPSAASVPTTPRSTMCFSTSVSARTSAKTPAAFTSTFAAATTRRWMPSSMAPSGKPPPTDSTSRRAAVLTSAPARSNTAVVSAFRGSSGSGLRALPPRAVSQSGLFISTSSNVARPSPARDAAAASSTTGSTFRSRRQAASRASRKS
ncbi:hypothetical protein DFH09DRAFT_1366291 [Mycena vulgaris]|nr:hypothetical protein DFH09DRAFT_1366291 [Mycena vulgaris]